MLQKVGSMAKEASPNARRLVLLVWILVAVLYFYLSYDYIRVTMHDRALEDYLRYVIQLAGDEQRSPKEVRAIILAKAGELGLPLNPEHIQIAGGGQSLKVSLNYDVDIELPILERGVYRKTFQHNVKYVDRRY